MLNVWTVRNSQKNLEMTRGYLLCRLRVRSRTTPSLGTDTDPGETLEANKGRETGTRGGIPSRWSTWQRGLTE